MKKMIRILSLAFALALVMTMVSGFAALAEEPRTITIGLWWDKYYDSTHTEITDDPGYQGTLSDQLRFDVVKKVEEKYNVRIEFVNLTYTGTVESINTSILAGTPDCDIYLVELSFGIPAAANGYFVDLKTILPEDSDIFNDQIVMYYLDTGDGTATLFKPASAATQVEATYPLAFNKQMLEDANLEDPRDLYARGEWTWDKFIEYCQTLTKDNDGDGTIDVYGFGGYQGEWFNGLCMSNGTYVARPGEDENWTSKEVGEVLQLMQDMYVTYNVAYPYDETDAASDTMRYLYRDGKVAFCPIAAWINSSNNDYDWDGTTGVTLDFDMVYVPWPVGPSGNQETNKQKEAGGEFYGIPVGVEDPELVYNVFYDWNNWYDFDLDIRDDYEALRWWYTCTAKDPEIQESNFEVMFEAGAREQFDNWDSLQVYPDFVGLFRGDYTVAQFQETYKQEIQDAMNRLAGK